jgi:D-glycero-D-manno-heptose 1,7-bisphosphate phosphatase
MTDATGGATRVAAFLDRDGTLIDDVHYIARAEHVVLRPGAAQAVRRLNDAGVLAVVVTNQSGIGRGLLTESDYQAVAARLSELLAAAGARVDATYHCPHDPTAGEPCECRKPALGMYRQAEREHGVDLARSAYIGDRLRDVEPSKPLGGRGILVPSPQTPYRDMARATDDFALATSLGAAVDRFLAALARPA